MDKAELNPHKPESKAAQSCTPEQREEPRVRYIAMPDYSSASLSDEDSIDLLALWQVLMERKQILIRILLLGIAIAAAVAFLSTPIYRAELLMASAAEEKGGGLSSLAGQFGGVAALAGISLPAGGSNVDRVMATLKSRAFLIPFLKQEKIITLLVDPSEDGSPIILNAYKVFSDNVLSLNVDSKTGLITLSIDWTEPELAAKWANILVARLNEHQRQNAISEAQQSIDYLNQQLAATSVVDMQQAIYRLIESQTKIIMLANVKKQYAMQVIDPAVPPEKKVRPKRALILVLGAVLSVFAGIFAIFLLHGLNSFKQRLAQGESPRAT